MIDERNLKISMNRILDSLNYNFSDFNVPGFVQHLESIKQKSFHFVPCKLVQYGVFGMWITSDRDELFFYERATVLAHRIHIIMHEIGHMLCGHQTEYRTPKQVTNILQSSQFDLLGVCRQNQKGRNGEIDDKEQQAEMLATLKFSV